MCIFSCPALLPGQFDQWCDACYREHGDYADDQCRLGLLARAHDDFDAIVPASREEWLAYLDDQAPLVMGLAECPREEDAICRV
jgi:hypothetical protein